MVFSHENIGAVNYRGTYDFTASAFGSDYTSKMFGIAAIWDGLYPAANSKVTECVRVGLAIQSSTVSSSLQGL